MDNIDDRINQLRTHFIENEIEAYIVPSTDEFLNEYVPIDRQRLKWITGFTGSNGLALITKNKKIFFTDGRYLTQAKNELCNDFCILNMHDQTTCMNQLSKISSVMTIGYDPMIHSEKNLSFLQNLFKNSEMNVNLKALDNNLIDTLRKFKESKTFNAVKLLDAKYVEVSEADKVNLILEKIDKKANYLLITDPASICWLLNIRGNDVPYTPLVLSYLLLQSNGDIELFANINRIKGSLVKVKIFPLQKIKQRYKEIIFDKMNVQLDTSTTAIWFIKNAQANQIIKKQNPCILPKAIKNNVEIAGIKYAHIQDGVAMCRFLYWLQNNINKRISELQASDKLLELRKKMKLFEYPSFATISASGSNAAIIHYTPNNKSDRIIDPNNLYLVDSGGQYMNGTTDVTRTLCFAKSPKEEYKKHYTLVLKGHINLATAKFPTGTSGPHLDALARMFLWETGLDYQHGTGHGVGHFLSVHEGPHNIGKSFASNCPLSPGMIVTNEPGYYKEKEYGIRIENIMTIVKSKYDKFLEFETITMVPIQYDLIDFTLLNKKEKLWLINYHTKILNKLSPYLDDEEINFLQSYIGHYKMKGI